MSRRSFYHARRAPDAPCAETLERLERRPVFRTDLHGDIEMSTDGERLWVEVEGGRELLPRDVLLRSRHSVGTSGMLELSTSSMATRCMSRYS